MKRVSWWVWVIIAIVGAAAILLGACGRPGSAPLPITCATYQAPDGTWMEEDNEPVDDDPCDTEMDYPKPAKTSKKPTVKPSPTKPAATPLGGRKKRF